MTKKLVDMATEIFNLTFVPGSYEKIFTRYFPHEISGTKRGKIVIGAINTAEGLRLAVYALSLPHLFSLL